MQPLDFVLSLKQTNQKSMKTHLNFFLIAFAGISLLSACDKHRFSSGPYTTEYRALDSDFQELIIDGSMNVEIVQSVDFDVKIEAGERRIGHIKTDVSNGKLRVYEEDNRVVRDKSVRVVVNKAYFEKIELNGSGELFGDGIVANDLELQLDGSGDVDLWFDALENLELELEGSGDIKLRGDAQSLNIELDGSGDIEAKGLHADEVEIYLIGSGDIETTALDVLNVSINGSGNVHYWGNPLDVDYSITGSGELIQH